jgi:hypothetical protein
MAIHTGRLVSVFRILFTFTLFTLFKLAIADLNIDLSCSITYIAHTIFVFIVCNQICECTV